MQKIGIYKDGKKLKLAFLSDQKDILEFKQVSQFTSEECCGELVSGISGDMILVRHLVSPLTSKRALSKTLPFQLENLIPFAFSEVIARPVYQIGKQETAATFFITSEKSLHQHIKSLEGIDPPWISCVPQALYRFAVWMGYQNEGMIILHVGRAQTEMVMIEKKMVCSCISLKVGIDLLEEAFERDRLGFKAEEWIDQISQLELEHVKKEEFPHLHEKLQMFKREIDRAFCFLTQKHGENQLHSILFAGEVQTVFQLERWIQNWDSFNFSVLPCTSVQDYSIEEIKKFAVPIGLSLDLIEQDQNSVQFRQGQWIAPEVYTKLKKRVIKGVSLCLASAVCLFACGHFIYMKKKRDLSEKIDQFAVIYQKDIPPLKKVPFLKGNHEKVQFLNQSIKVSSQEHRYFLTPPRVSDVLVFLSTHPKLCRKEGGQAITLTRLNYELINFPSIQKPFESYKVKVNVNFNSPHSVWAREFHDAIVEDGKRVNLEEEITWEREEDAYTLSFILK